LPTPSQPLVRIGARGSKLSLIQAGWVQRRIAAALGVDPAGAEAAAPLIRITTTGDRVQDRRLLEIGGKALFTKEIEEALLDGRIDCAVHSLKDMPAELPPGLVIGAIPQREDARDVFISHRARTLDALPPGATLGTASLRRQAQALHRRPDLKLVNLRGNVDTRLAKLEAGEADAIILALAGLNRMASPTCRQRPSTRPSSRRRRARARSRSRSAPRTPRRLGWPRWSIAPPPWPSPRSAARSPRWKARARPPSVRLLKRKASGCISSSRP